MAKLYFRYSAMNSGKSTMLIQAAHNYEERGMEVLVIKPWIDSKGADAIVSRLGTTRIADIAIKPNKSLITEIEQKSKTRAISCILVDEAQFLDPDQVDELFWYAVVRDVPVLAYGLRTDFMGVGFPGSTRMLELAHELQEMKTICRCGKKALFNGRKVNGTFVNTGSQVAIDGEDLVEYESLCALCYKEKVL
jgi:thymidine kinase